MNWTDQFVWSADWAWSLPLIVLTVVIHVLCLGFFNETVVPALTRVNSRHSTGVFVVVMTVTILLTTVLHGVEVAIWAAAYRLLGALPDVKHAMLYSLNSMTTYGHANLFLKDHWRLMGSLEALNGLILFGLTTAFLFMSIQRIWPVGGKGGHVSGDSEPHRVRGRRVSSNGKSSRL